jgi:voltage-gated potassium channel Kch
MKPMKRSVKDKLRYRFDNTISRGTLPVILWLAVFTIALVFVAALILTLTGTDVNNGDNGLAENFWQSFLRILDPGTFSGDAGWFLRIVTLLVTLLGISIAAVLIGLIATGIEERIEQLRRGRSAVVETEHTLILGYSPRIFTIVSELCIANENRRKPCIVVLAGEEKESMEDELSSRIGDPGNTKVVVRTGDPASLHDLGLVNVSAARSVILLGTADDPAGDAEVVKAVLAVLAVLGSKEVPIVAELSDRETAAALGEASGGRVLTVSASEVIARITAQACRQAGLSAVCQDLLDFDGDEIYFQPAGEVVGHTFGEALLAYDTSSVIGRRTAAGAVEVNPPMETVFAEGDAVIAVSEDDDTVVFTGFRDESVPPPPAADNGSATPERLLLIGWNPLGPQILRELDQFVPEGSTADVLADPDLVDASEPSGVDLNRLAITVEPSRGDLDRLTSHVSDREFDHVIILGYRGGLSPAEADARTLLTLLLLHRAFADKPAAVGVAARRRIVTELLDSRDVELARATGADDFVVSDALSSYFMAQLSESPELNAVFEDLFDAEGSAIGLKPVSRYLSPDGSIPFSRFVAAARARGEVALGYRTEEDERGPAAVVMNPAKAAEVTLRAGDQLVVIGPPE